MDKSVLIKEFNSLGIENMPLVTELFLLKGEFVNLCYQMPSGEIKLLDDNSIYLGAQLECPGQDRCFGLVANEDFLPVCKYGAFGKEPELIMYKKR